MGSGRTRLREDLGGRKKRRKEWRGCSRRRGRTRSKSRHWGCMSRTRTWPTAETRPMAELRGRRPGRLACWRAAEGSCEVAWPCSRVRRLQDKGVRKRRKERRRGGQTAPVSRAWSANIRGAGDRAPERGSRGEEWESGQPQRPGAKRGRLPILFDAPSFVRSPPSATRPKTCAGRVFHRNISLVIVHHTYGGEGASEMSKREAPSPTGSPSPEPPLAVVRLALLLLDELAPQVPLGVRPVLLQGSTGLAPMTW